MTLRTGSFGLRLLSAAGVLAAAAWQGPAAAQASPQDVLAAVVRLTAEIPADARTAEALGTEREGSGVVIDDSGLVLTIGYLILEAMSATVYGPDGTPVLADVIAYDHKSGFGLVRAREDLGVTPVRLGDSRELEVNDRVLAVSYGGAPGVRGALVASRRQFAGYWEYLLDRAIFTIPPHPRWSGAALIGSDAKLLGIGSLIVGDAVLGEHTLPGNMFVPIDLLKPILADLLSEGRRAGPGQPWLGVFLTDVPGGALVTRVAPGGPAEASGLRPGDVVVGVAGEAVTNLPDLYRHIWAQGKAGADIPLTYRRGTRSTHVTVTSGDRDAYLRLHPSY